MMRELVTHGAQSGRFAELRPLGNVYIVQGAKTDDPFRLLLENKTHCNHDKNIAGFKMNVYVLNHI